MIDFSNAVIENIIVHKVGNKTREEGVVFSNNILELQGDMLKDLLLKFFLSPFKNDDFYSFFHETDVNLNETYLYSSKIFQNEVDFFEQSKNIAYYLYEQSAHPKINTGEFYVVSIKNCVIDDELVDAIGLFKTENKDTYLQVKEKDKSFEIAYQSGININKLDKGCLIFDTEKDNGYIVSMVDTMNKSGAAQYWKDNFLKIKPREDDYYCTQNYLNMCKDFVDKSLEETDKSEKIELKNNTINYFKEKETFNVNEFKEEVISNPETQEAFKEYVQNYATEKDINISENFDISKNAVKKAKQKYKSVIKLDKNFHIYVHGKQELIEKGVDEHKSENNKYYKLYFSDEN
jgi:hypothetical protein